jgi:hypothetical protein
MQMLGHAKGTQNEQPKESKPAELADMENDIPF